METISQDSNQIINIADCLSTILMDERYLIAANAKTVLFPDSETQYFINNTGDILLDCVDENPVNNSEVLHLIDNTKNEGIEDLNQIVYLTNEDILPSLGLGLMEGIEQSIIKIESDNEYLDLNTLLNVKNEPAEDNDVNGFQYIVQLEDQAPLSVPDVKIENILEHNYYERDENIIIGSIPFKNSKTCQTETIDLENENKKNEHMALSNLLNKKLTIGKTVNGQRLVGRVIHVGKKEVKEEMIEVETVEDDNPNILDQSDTDISVPYYGDVENYVPKYVIIEDYEDQNADILLQDKNELQTSIESKDDTIHDKTSLNQNMLEYISKTMFNLIGMKSVLKKLKRKNLLITVLEKVVNKDRVLLNTFQIGGHLEMIEDCEKNENEGKWMFHLEFEEDGEESGEFVKFGSRKFPETIRLSISIVKVDNSIQSTKVNLTHNLEKCNVCSKDFKSLHKLKIHMKSSHNLDCQYRCQICDQSLESKEVYDQHKINHVDKNELFPCPQCDKHFVTVQKLARHLHIHSTDGLKLVCTICGEVFEEIETWKDHTLRHEWTDKLIPRKNRNQSGNCQSRHVKNCYECKVCGRTFSRYSNLQRHSEIHVTKNSMAVYSCSMCSCTYNYISSLTRHIVQNHISAT